MVFMTNNIQLLRGEVRKFAPGALRVEAGTAWITATGCAEDFVLEAGEALPTHLGELLVEPLGPFLILSHGKGPARARLPKKLSMPY